MGIRMVACATLALVGLGQACGGAGRRTAVDEVPRVDLGQGTVELPVGGDTCILEGPAWVTAVEPKPISEAVRRGLAWLLETQQQDGGWSQGEESRNMGHQDGQVRSKSNVADSCITILAFLRASPEPSEGPYASAIARGAGYVCSEIEASDETSLYVTSVRGTRVQSKIGTYVDTFFASMVLAELKGRTGDEALDARVSACLDKVVDKIERNQQSNGAFEGQGWAPVLSQAMAGKGLNRALQVGVKVDLDAIKKNETYFLGVAAADAPTPDSAGVALYSSSAGLAGLQESTNSGYLRERELKDLLASTDDEEAREQARVELDDIAAGRRAQEEAQSTMLGRLDDPSFVSGFGSNGGEEFLSYMNIAESLVVRADDAWRRFDAGMTQNLERIQNQDGSWSGHHCITGRNFCTSAALLTLLADRTPVPQELVAAAR